MHSLHSRLLLAASLVLAGFLGATGLALDKAFRVSAKAAMQDRLQSHIYALLAAADEDENGHDSAAGAAGTALLDTGFRSLCRHHQPRP